MAKYTSKYTGEEIDAKHGAHLFDSNTNELIHFGSEAEKQKYIEGDTSVVLGRTPFEFNGMLYRINIVNNMGNTTLNYTQNTPSVDISVDFQLQGKSITDVLWEDVVGAKYRVLVQVDKGNKNEWSTYLDTISDGSLNVQINNKTNFSIGTNRLRIEITDTEGMAKNTILYVVNVTSMYLVDAGVEWNIPFFADQTKFTIGLFKIGGAINKSFNMRIQGDGVDYTYSKNIGTQQNVENGTSIELTGFAYPSDIDGPINGTYDVAFWLEANGVSSEVLRYRMMFVSDKSSQLVCINEVNKVYNEEASKLFAYSIYNGGEVYAQPSIVVSYGDKDIITNNNLTVGTQTKIDFSGVISVSSFDDIFNVVANVSCGNGSDSTTIVVDNTKSFPATLGGLTFYLNAATRSNNDNNRNKIINEAPEASVLEYETTTEEVTFIDGMDGWTVDDEGVRCLRLQAKSKMTIQGFNPMAQNANDVYQGSLEFVYKAVNPSSDDEALISILDSNGYGIKISPKHIYVKSNIDASYDKQDYHPYADERLHIMITFSKNYLQSGENFVVIYANGGVVREFTYAGNESFGSTANVVLGSETSDLYLYKMRTYNLGLERSLVVNNYLNGLPTREKQLAESERIGSIVVNNIIDYDTCVSNGYNTMVIEMLEDKDGKIPDLPSLTNDAEGLTCNLNINIRQKTSDGSLLVDTEIDEEMAGLLKGMDILGQPIEGQGTTAMTYGRWNFRWKLGSEYGKRRITAKKNFASSMHSHKMGATRLFNLLHERLGLTNEANGKVAVTQYPVYGFKKTLIGDGVYGYEFIGLYTVGADKGDKDTFGYSSEAFEDTLIHMEGSDHNATIVGMEYPWMDDGSTIAAGVERLGAIGADGGVSNSWEVGACGPYDTEKDFQDMYTMLKREFRDAYMVAYRNSPNVAYIDSSTLSSIITDSEQAEAWNNTHAGIEFWDDSYDLYYYNVADKVYKKSMNILTDLGVASVSGDTKDAQNEEIIRLRKERFASEWGTYWNTDDCIFHFAFCQLIGATDNFKKNTYPYKFKSISDGGKWRWRQDDLDTIFDVDNTGNSVKTYSIMVGDKQGADSIYKGEDSVFWTLVRLTQGAAINDMTKRMLDIIKEVGVGQNTQERLVNGIKKIFWDNAQFYFPPNAYNADANWSYETSYLNKWYTTPNPLEQSLGSHYETEYDWITLRMIFISSMLSYGAFANETGYADQSLGRLTYRGGDTYTFNLRPAVDMNPTLMVGTNSITTAGGRVHKGETVEIIQPSLTGQNTQVYITGLDYYESLGSLAKLVIEGSSTSESPDGTQLAAGSLAIVSAKRLTEFIIGDDDKTEVTSNITNVTLGDCPSLEKFDGRHSKLAGSLDLRNCPRIQEVYLTGSSVSSVSLPAGSKIKTLHLSASSKAITLNGLNYLMDLQIPNLTTIETLIITDCGSLGIDVLLDILGEESNSLTDVSITFEEVTVNNEQFHALYELTQKEGFNSLSLSGTIIVDDLIYEHEQKAIEDKNVDKDKLEIVTKEEYYMYFEDPIVREIMAKNFGDGVGVTHSTVKTITSLAGYFSKTDIETFNELKDFTRVLDLATISGVGCFEGCENLKELTFSVNLQTMGAYCFRGCSSLNIELVLPEYFYGGTYGLNNAIFSKSGITAVKSFGNAKFTGDSSYGYLMGSFYQCPNLITVNFDEGFEVIGHYMFYECTSLKTVNFPSSLRVINPHAFRLCSELEIGSLSLPHLEKIGLAAFNNAKITEVTDLGYLEDIPANPDNAYYTLGSPDYLTKLILPSGLKSIGQSAFRGYKMLHTVEFNEALETIGATAFYNCTLLTVNTLNIPNVISWGYNAFFGCQITSIVANSLPSIADYSETSQQTWGSRANLQNVEMKGLTSIGAYAFYNYANLKTFTANWGNVKTIGNSAFYGCSSLTFEELSLDSLQTISNAAFCNVSIKKITSLGSIVVLSNSGTGSETLGESTALESVVLPETLRTLGQYAFYNYTKLTDINLPQSIETVGYAALYGVPFTAEVNLPNLQSVDQLAFAGTSITTVSNLGKITALYSNSTAGDGSGRGTFQYCTSLQTVNLPDTLESIGFGTFYGCTSLSSINFPSSIKTIRRGAFYNCSSLGGHLTIDAEIVEYAAFMKTNISSIYLPNITKLNESPWNYYGTFNGCNVLSLIHLGPNVELIGKHLCRLCTTNKVLICEAVNPPTLGTELFQAGTGTFSVIYVPNDSVNAYKAATNWNTYASVIKSIDDMDDDTKTLVNTYK